jgi:iron complex transport system substrate-binding protein
VAEILNMILVLSSMVGAAEKGKRLLESLEKNLSEVKEASKSFERKPRVYFEEWDQPMISGIRWVSELVEIAGGEDVFSELSHSHSATGRIVSDPGTVVEKQPEVILGSWCGRKFRPEAVKARAGWDAIPAVRQGELHEIKSAEILQPGPAALSDGVRRIHGILRDFVSRAPRTRP